MYCGLHSRPLSKNPKEAAVRHAQTPAGYPAALLYRNRPKYCFQKPPHIPWLVGLSLPKNPPHPLPLSFLLHSHKCPVLIPDTANIYGATTNLTTFLIPLYGLKQTLFPSQSCAFSGF